MQSVRDGKEARSCGWSSVALVASARTKREAEMPLDTEPFEAAAKYCCANKSTAKRSIKQIVLSQVGLIFAGMNSSGWDRSASPVSVVVLITTEPERLVAVGDVRKWKLFRSYGDSMGSVGEVIDSSCGDDTSTLIVPTPTVITCLSPSG